LILLRIGHAWGPGKIRPRQLAHIAARAPTVKEATGMGIHAMLFMYMSPDWKPEPEDFMMPGSHQSSLGPKPGNTIEGKNHHVWSDPARRKWEPHEQI
jgi:hypothetical protein